MTVLDAGEHRLDTENATLVVDRRAKRTAIVGTAIDILPAGGITEGVVLSVRETAWSDPR
jgi:hypothetical protein